MCFTCKASSTSDESQIKRTHHGGVRNKLVEISRRKRNEPTTSPQSKSRKSSLCFVTDPEFSAKVDTVLRDLPPAENDVKKSKSLSTNRTALASVADTAVENREALTKITLRSSQSVIQSEPRSIFASDSDAEEHLETSDKIKPNLAQLNVKVKTKQVKGLIRGMGKELKRAATTVSNTWSENIPTKIKYNSTEEERQKLLPAEPLKPHLRNTDEIKQAYGHTTSMRHGVDTAGDKLRERGEKLSTIRRRTSQLEAEAANFQSLAQDLAKKIESKKWYKL